MAKPAKRNNRKRHSIPRNADSDKLPKPSRKKSTNNDKYQTQKETLDLEREGAVIGEINQRIRIKDDVIFLGKVVLGFMAAVLVGSLAALFICNGCGCPDCSEVCMKCSSGNSWAVTISVGGPIISITTITVMFFVGAFKKFDDDDLKSAGKGAMKNAADMAKESAAG